MSKATHTPGPWTVYQAHPAVVSECGEHPASIRAGIYAIATVREQGHSTFANARLIASAPDLLAACKAVYAAFGLAQSLPLGFPAELERILRAAIAKAEGGDQ